MLCESKGIAMDFFRFSKKSLGSGLAGGLEFSPDLENLRNFKKIHGNP